MKREPIKTPFLSKSKESDYHESLAIFKLILRFMNDNNLSGRKEKVRLAFFPLYIRLTLYYIQERGRGFKPCEELIYPE